MIKIFLFLLLGTFLFAQIKGNTIIERHTLEVGNWVDKYQEPNNLFKKPLKNSLNDLHYKSNLEHTTEGDICKYFLSSKTSNRASCK